MTVRAQYPVFGSRRGIERSKAFSAVRSAERILGIYEEVSRNRGGE
jgi:hypothetical protein